MESAESGGSHSKAASARKLIASAIKSADVPFDARALFILLASFANADGSRCYPSMATLAEKSAHSLPWIKRNLRLLRNAGWITSGTKITKGGRVNLYTLHWGNIGPEK